MRLWEIKVLLEKVLNDDAKIFIDSETIYWWQAYKIKNYKSLFDVFDILNKQEWNQYDFSNVEQVSKKYRKLQIVQVEWSDFNQINSYIWNLNTYIPLYYSILTEMVDEQDEQIINIKIPEGNIKSLKNLSEFNNRLDKNFKEFAIDWQFEFKWLDKWTSWYEILITGIKTYWMFLACLKIAQEYLKTKQEYYKTKKAELDYKAWLNKPTDFTKDWLEKYIDRRLELEVEEKIKESIESLKIENWKSQMELQSQIIKATKGLIKELWNWTEFHLSLNPPKYASEMSWSINIDYVKLAEIRESENKTKQIESPKDKE